MSEPYGVQLSRARGYRIPEGTIKVDRSTRWGNMFWPGQRVISPGAYGSLASPYHGSRPVGTYGSGPRGYTIRKVRDAEDAVALFASYVRCDPSGWPPEEIRYELRGHPLGCWCPLDAWCHRNVLLALANGWDMPPEPTRSIFEEVADAPAD